MKVNRFTSKRQDIRNCKELGIINIKEMKMDNDPITKEYKEFMKNEVLLPKLLDSEYDNICACKHYKYSHPITHKWSEAENRMINDMFCNVRGCKCHHFQMTIYVSQSGKIPEKQFYEKSNEVQLEMFT